MSTSVAMAGIAASNAAMAAASAQQAKVERCKATMPNFNAQQSTIEEKREYAECVNAVYPRELGADAILMMKALFVVALIGAAIGAWRELKSVWCDAFGVAAMALMGFVVAPLCVVAVAGVMAGVAWLFS